MPTPFDFFERVSLSCRAKNWLAEPSEPIARFRSGGESSSARLAVPLADLATLFHFPDFSWCLRANLTVTVDHIEREAELGFLRVGVNVGARFVSLRSSGIVAQPGLLANIKASAVFCTGRREDISSLPAAPSVRPRLVLQHQPHTRLTELCPDDRVDRRDTSYLGIRPLRPVRIQPVSISQPGVSRGSHTPPPCTAELGPVPILRTPWRQCSERLGVLRRYRPPASSLNFRYCASVSARQRRDLPQPKSNALPNPSAIMQN
jgi:hypothetical protein